MNTIHNYFLFGLLLFSTLSCTNDKEITIQDSINKCIEQTKSDNKTFSDYVAYELLSIDQEAKPLDEVATSFEYIDASLTIRILSVIKKCGLKPIYLFQLGPIGPLRTFDIILKLPKKENEKDIYFLRITHERISAKGKTVFSPNLWNTHFKNIENFGIAKEHTPPFDYIDINIDENGKQTSTNSLSGLMSEYEILSHIETIIFSDLEITYQR